METEHRGQPLLSAVLMRRMTRGFVSEAGGFSLPAWNYSRAVFSGAARGQRHGSSGALGAKREWYLSQVQEKARMLRTERRRSPTTGQPYSADRAAHRAVDQMLRFKFSSQSAPRRANQEPPANGFRRQGALASDRWSRAA
jgi:hypothetical protein